jgi:hypothetical protein
MNTVWILPLALGLGLSASAGFRVFVPLIMDLLVLALIFFLLRKLLTRKK